jgi:hypothetical protein
MARRVPLEGAVPNTVVATSDMQPHEVGDTQQDSVELVRGELREADLQVLLAGAAAQ